MAELKEEYKKFLEDMEKNIKNKEDLDYIKERFSLFIDIVLEKMDEIVKNQEEKMKELEGKQSKIEENITKIQQVVDNIEKDIYSEDGFDFEIVCPYCNYEFVIDVDENKTEIECPECQNIIELDWSGDIDEDEHGQCHGSCSHCSGCEDQNDDNNNDDDM